MADQHNSFGGHNRLWGYRIGGPNRYRMLNSSIEILGGGGKVRPAFTLNDLTENSTRVRELLSAMEYIRQHGLEVLYTFGHGGASGLTQEDKNNIIASLQVLQDQKYGISHLEFGNEVDTPDYDVLQYRLDLQWFSEQANAHLPGIPVYGPSLTPSDTGLAFLTSYYNTPGGLHSVGIDVHKYSSFFLESAESASAYFFSIIQLALSRSQIAISTEFCGCSWGSVTSGASQPANYRDELGQATNGIANLLVSLASGIKHVYWSSFPEDVVWGSDPGDILFHTGACVGEWAASNCYEAAGEWRHIAFAIQLLASTWRDYSIMTPGAKSSPGTDITHMTYPSTNLNVGGVHAFYYHGYEHGTHNLTLNAPLGTMRVVDIDFASINTTIEASSPGPKTYAAVNMPRMIIFLKN